MSMIAMLIQGVDQLPPPENLPSAIPQKVSPSEAASQVQYGSLFDNHSLILAGIILVFGLIALRLLQAMCRDHHEQFELRIFTITILVFGSLLVAAAGFSKDQLTPLIGFFGTIAGYILGRGELLEDRSRKPEGSNARRNERS